MEGLANGMFAPLHFSEWGPPPCPPVPAPLGLQRGSIVTRARDTNDVVHMALNADLEFKEAKILIEFSSARI